MIFSAILLIFHGRHIPIADIALYLFDLSFRSRETATMMATSANIKTTPPMTPPTMAPAGGPAPVVYVMLMILNIPSRYSQ